MAKLGDNKMKELMEEKCICCNGSCKQQEFDDKLKRWVKSEKDCVHCKGQGVRYFELSVEGNDFMKKKTYISRSTYVEKCL